MGQGLLVGGGSQIPNTQISQSPAITYDFTARRLWASHLSGSAQR